MLQRDQDTVEEEYRPVVGKLMPDEEEPDLYVT
jgi:hypothetical protein